MKCPWGDFSAEQQETETFSAVPHMLEQQLHLMAKNVLDLLFRPHDPDAVILQTVGRQRFVRPPSAHSTKAEHFSLTAGMKRKPVFSMSHFVKPVHSSVSGASCSHFTSFSQISVEFQNKSAFLLGCRPFPLLGSSEHSCLHLTGD